MAKVAEVAAADRRNQHSRRSRTHAHPRDFVERRRIELRGRLAFEVAGSDSGIQLRSSSLSDCCLLLRARLLCRHCSCRCLLWAVRWAAWMAAAIAAAVVIEQALQPARLRGRSRSQRCSWVAAVAEAAAWSGVTRYSSTGSWQQRCPRCCSWRRHALRAATLLTGWRLA